VLSPATSPAEPERFDRLDRLIAEDRLIRNAWTGEDGHGRATACLLAALSPEAGESRKAYACPATVMPGWLARVTTRFDDEGTLEAWPGMVRRYANLARRWYVLDAETWMRVQYTSRALLVREAMLHTKDESVLNVCKQVAELCVRRASGEPKLGHLFAQLRTLAASAKRAAWAAEGRAAAWAAEAAAAEAAVWAAVWAAEAAAEEAVWAAAAEAAAEAEAAEAEEAAAGKKYAPETVEKRDAARRAATDRITAGILDAIEKAVVGAEGRAA
jgi:hypothetical protein